MVPVQLLALERSLSPAPALVRARAEEFAQSVVRLRTLPPYSLAGEGLAATRPVVWMAAAGVAAVLLVVLVGLGGGGPWSLRAPARTSGVVTREEPGARTPSASTPRRRDVPVFQSPPAPGTPRFSPMVARELGQGLTGWWPMDDGTGARVARDRSGANRHCRFHGPRGREPVWIAGVAGRALALNATTWLYCPQPEVARSRPSP